MSKTIDLYWDLGSTNTYFAIKLLEPLADKYGAKINWHAFNVGFVFQSNNYVLMDEPRAKLINRRDDLYRWAEKYDLPFKVPEAFPIKQAERFAGQSPCVIGIWKRRSSARLCRRIGNGATAQLVRMKHCVKLHLRVLTLTPLKYVRRASMFAKH